jgi:hypothetical protein
MPQLIVIVGVNVEGFSLFKLIFCSLSYYLIVFAQHLSFKCCFLGNSKVKVTVFV